MPTPQQGRFSVNIAAPPQLVYDLIADIARMGEWSPECYSCEWLDGATAAAVDARFRGYNRLGRYRWERTAIITAAEPGREFSFVTVDDRTGREETRWQYIMEPSPSGTLLTESFQFVWCSTLDRVMELLLPRGRQVERGMKETLRRLKLAAEAHQATNPG
ncbi:MULTISPECIES: SRPBCC family protein [Mycobacterium]|uniref:Cyclase n=1 Tax=Mycobacterium kiyosense TaxID=2871094 RepID=A0AA37Q993_9MYCO|nr:MULTISPECIES: SRPBCC family protein [Mycobacterium]BDE17187.1 cyclase [Mycobacterium sp. 20KCMC460]GLB85671.1 cyclase [Mycobacterium kiyosense]GLB92649.1 cyclase [Mycobacterium kiyosense]GLB98706.1 cyclase [Mycobacterium kiyosense]GLC04664.1 cyclase [Mycobacterium kiyosense]